MLVSVSKTRDLTRSGPRPGEFYDVNIFVEFTETWNIFISKGASFLENFIRWYEYNCQLKEIRRALAQSVSDPWFWKETIT